ncbi:MAG: hypothetical protein KDC98_26245, partial [Planctomycetes bacterium]|nr:hypothetical protein [Planctomycetota bacterium]
MSAVPESGAPASTPRRSLQRMAGSSFTQKARGEPMLWLCGGSLAICLFMVFGLLLLVGYQGTATFWPTGCVLVELHDGTAQLGEPTRDETYSPSPGQLETLPEAERAGARARLEAEDGVAHRRQLRTGNYRITNTHFHWVSDFEIAAESLPEWAMVIERQEWGRFYGTPVAFMRDDQAVATAPATIYAEFGKVHDTVRERFHEIEGLRKHGIGHLSDVETAALLRARTYEIDEDYGTSSPQYRQAYAAYERLVADNAPQRAEFEQRIATLQRENDRLELRMRTAAGVEVDLMVADIVRAYPANQLSFGERAGVYLDRWVEFLFDDPRESNTEGGVWPAIFGTILMTLLM